MRLALEHDLITGPKRPGHRHAQRIHRGLVERGIPFRRAHALVGALVRRCAVTGTGLRDLDAPTLRGYSPHLTPALVRGLTPARSVARRRVLGGTAPREVQRQLARAEREDGR